MVEECKRKKRQLKIYKKWRRGNDEKETYRKKSEEKNLRSCAKRRKKKDWKSWRKKLEIRKQKKKYGK